MGQRIFSGCACDEQHEHVRNVKLQRIRGVPSLAVVTAVAALAGCGGSDKDSPPAQKPQSATVSGSQRGILTTVDALQTASRKGDGRTICAELFTPQLVKSVEAAAKRSCAKEVRQRLFTPDAEISVGRDIKVSGDRGTAVVLEQNGNVSTLSMLKQSSQWRIDRVAAKKSG
jgi:hypothetical protein